MTLDKTTMRKTNGCIDFGQVGDPAGTRVMIEPRTGDRWRVTIFDDAQLTENVCHVQDIHTHATDRLELLRVALNAYRDYRGPVLDRRLAQHAAGQHCDACGTDHYPHGDKA